MKSGLQDKVVLVTGAARRVGAVIARSLHAEGARLALHCHRSLEAAQALAAEMDAARPGSAQVLQADLLDTAGLPRLVDETLRHFGRLDALVNNASSFHATPLGSIGEDDWADLVGSNLKAPLFLSQAAAPHLAAARGAIVNITDIHDALPLKDYPLYCAAKAGLSGLTRALALELGPQVRVNAVAPGPILWPEDDSFDDSARAAIIERTLLKRRGDPDDIARSVLFLLAEAPYVTGQILAVDGGRSLSL
ncbi:MAG TPA: pteridine reductase [Candidatus Desulfobacillus sp.]|nr:pteridine reductase [Candidatus Desulfobacillus sp.]